MSVSELIESLEKIKHTAADKIVVLSDGTGWDNIGAVIEEISTVTITMCGNPPFQD